MHRKKIFMLAVSLFFILAVSAVSANENITEDIASEQNIEVDLTLQDENVSDADQGTFTALDSLINDNNDTDVYLESNFTYEATNDSSFKNGISIDRAVTVHGNGHTIDGNNAARIFSVTNTSVVFMDIIFVNGKTTTNGGAIYGSSTIINCSFIGNSARNGGATYGNCTAINCTFMDNAAQQSGSSSNGGDGGAMFGMTYYSHYSNPYGCSAINCTFINNRAVNFGGGLFGGFAVNCTFRNNRAWSGGGALSGNAVNSLFIGNSVDQSGGSISGNTIFDEFFAFNCTFANNSARFGGALDGINAISCNFTNNSASSGGGAMQEGNALNCTFIANNAYDGSSGYRYGGGATMYVSCENCTFIANHANYYGGAMYGSDHKATGCIFMDNTAKCGGATYLVNANGCEFTNNSAAENGGAMYAGVCANSNFTQNHADMDGGAAFDVITSNALFEHNWAVNGGAIAEGKAIDSIFTHNNASGFGGAACNARISTNNLFADNSAPNGNDTFNETWFEKANSKTFADLNELINGNDDEDVYLDGNYIFDPHYDFAFLGGVVIARAVTIHGNGFAIDGWEATRIFTAANQSAVFMDIDFVNGKILSGNGAAISGISTAINCSFENNSAFGEYSSGGALYHVSAISCTFTNNYAGSSGGAMDFGDAINCNFTDNRAESRGGAICSGKAVNCIFINNSAKEGGAIYGSADNSVFINNSADNGGAMYQGRAENCTFNGNSAILGGAMNYGTATNSNFTGNSAKNGGAAYDVDAINCTFTSNNASDNGGAMYYSGSSATNCQFISNTAKNGGATYSITATECLFTSNNATEYGGAMSYGTANDCIFKDNHAGMGDNNTYEVDIHQPTLSVSDYQSAYNSGSRLAIRLIAGSGKQITTANVTIRVYKNNVSVGTYHCLSGDGWVVSLDAGNYTAIISIENQGFDIDPVNATLTITKASSKISASAVTAVYNVNKYLTVTLKDSQNRPVAGVYVTIKLSSGKTAKVKTNANGQAKMATSGLVPKTYTATATFESVNYIKSTCSAKVVVKKATPKLTAKAASFKQSVKTKKYTITLKDNVNKAIKNTKVTLKVNGKTFSAKTNAKGVAAFKLTNLNKKGKFTAVVKFAGNKYYNAKTVKPKITIK